MARPEDVIASAILGKYNDLSVEEITVRVQQAATTYLTHPEKSERSDFERDIVNQLKCFEKIENDWGHRPLNIALLTRINSTSRGISITEAKLRDVDRVEDYDDQLPTTASKIVDRLSELDECLAKLDKASASSETLDRFTTMLAEAFGLIIAVHPFMDGNGRTARFLMQLVLFRNNCEYLVIPKYRNDTEWRSALSAAVKGHSAGVAKFLLANITYR